MDHQLASMVLDCDQPVAHETAAIEDETEDSLMLPAATTPVEDQVVKKRRDSKVRFPSEDQLTRVLELGSPWDNAPTTNKDETLEAYRVACTAYKLKPLAKVLQQLESIENFKERAALLDLKGLRLDNRSCEALEAVFKRLQFVTVDLEGTSMEDDGAMAIFEMIDFYESATRLIVSHNGKLGCRAWVACSKMMKKSPCLEYLDVRNNVFDEYTIPLIGRPIRANCLLTTLHIEGCQMSGRVHLIMVAALKTNTHLTELFLGNNRLIADDMVHLGNVLKLNTTLQVLDLRDNMIQDDGVRFLCEGLLEQQSGLCSLVLWNNRITPQGMHAVAAVLPFHASLETLNLGSNRIESSGCQLLKPGMLVSKSLLRLGLVNCKVTCEGAIALAEVIGDNTILERLDIRDNDIRVAGLMALALAHRVSHHLVRLDIKRNVRVDQRDADMVKNFFKDIERYSQRNKMEHEEREARRIVLKRQQELEDQKKQEEEQHEAERRSEALAALSTALHAQALAEGQGLPTMPRLDEAEEEGENGDADRDQNLLLDRPQPVDEELDNEDAVENKEGYEIIDENEVVQQDDVRTCDELETENADIQSESTQNDLTNHVGGPSLSDDLGMYSLAESSVNGGNAVTVTDTEARNTESSKHSALVEDDDVDQSPGIDSNGDNVQANS